MSKVRLLCSTFCLFTVALPAGALTLTQFNSPLTEGFDSLAATGTATAVPAGWSFTESGSGANATYSAGTGSSSTGDTYSFGSAGSTDRALGTLSTSSLVSSLTLGLSNGTGGIISRLGVSYTGEQWRLGSTGRNDRLDFAYSLDGVTWTDVDALDFVAPVSTGTVGALDGNAPANRLDVSYTITGLTIPHGQSFWLRWSDFPAAGSDDGLGIDNFSVTALQPLSPPVGGSVPDTLPVTWTGAAFGVVLWAGRRRSSFAVGRPREATATTSR